MAKRRGRRNPKPAVTQREQRKGKSKSVSYSIPAPTIRRPRKQAIRDINLAYDPLLEDIAAQQNQVRDEFQENDAAYRNIGKGLDAALDNIPRFGEKYEGIADDVNRHTNRTANNFQRFAEMEQPVGQDFATGGLPEEYADANAQALKNLGGTSNSYQELLGLMRADQTGYSRSIRNQSAVALGNRRANALEEMTDAIAKLRQGRLDILEDRPEEILSRTDELRRGKFDQSMDSYRAQMAEREQQAQDRLRRFLMNEYRNKLANRRNRGGGGGGGGGGPQGINAAERQAGVHNKRRRSGGGTGSGPQGINAGEQQAGQLRPRKKYDRLTNRIQQAHEDVEGEWYHPATGKWYTGGVPRLSTIGATPVSSINKPNRRRRRLVKRHPKLEGRARRRS